MNTAKPKYDEEFQNLSQKIEKLQLELNKHPDAADDEIADGITINGAYERVKMINKKADLERHLGNQKAEVHEIVREAGGQIVCSCSLIVNENLEDPDNYWDLVNAHGHINNATGDVIQQFLIAEYPNDNDQDVEYLFFCQLCNKSETASSTVNILPHENELTEFRTKHVGVK